MKQSLPEPFQTYWSGSTKRPKLSNPYTSKDENELQDEAWLALRQAIQREAEKQWKMQ